MTTGKAHLSHIVMFCFDFEKMLDFYTRVIDFRLSDIGHARGNRICFLMLDPENNRMEFFWDTPYYVQQPIVEPLDFALSDQEMLQSVVLKYGNDPSFKPMAEWKAEQRRALAATRSA